MGEGKERKWGRVGMVRVGWMLGRRKGKGEMRGERGEGVSLMLFDA